MCRQALESQHWLRPLLFLAADAAAHSDRARAAAAVQAVTATLEHCPMPEVRLIVHTHIALPVLRQTRQPTLTGRAQLQLCALCQPPCSTAPCLRCPLRCCLLPQLCWSAWPPCRAHTCLETYTACMLSREQILRYCMLH